MATEGLRESWIECSTWSSRPSYSATEDFCARISSNSEMSAPEANASVPAPRNATQRTSGSASNWAIARGIPRHIAALMALRFAGWLNTIQPTAPRFSTIRLMASRTAVDRGHGGTRVARAPAPGLDLVEEALDELVEECRLLEVDGMAAAR